MKTKPIHVTLTTMKYNKRLYGAGAVTVTLGGAPMDGVAVRAGKEKHITTFEYAHKWLTDRGLDPTHALSLINAALNNE